MAGRKKDGTFETRRAGHLHLSAPHLPANSMKNGGQKDGRLKTPGRKG
jgi:hypothetical protein